MNSGLSGFSEGNRQLTCRCLPQTRDFPENPIMFAFERSAAAVLMPLALLVAAVLWSRHEDPSAAPPQAHMENPDEGVEDAAQTVAANFPSR